MSGLWRSSRTKRACSKAYFYNSARERSSLHRWHQIEKRAIALRWFFFWFTISCVFIYFAEQSKTALMMGGFAFIIAVAGMENIERYEHPPQQPPPPWPTLNRVWVLIFFLLTVACLLGWPLMTSEEERKEIRMKLKQQQEQFSPWGKFGAQ